MAQHTTARLYCTKDTHVSKSYPTQNFHNADYTNMGVAGGQQNAALLAFDTNHGIAAGARILSAKLHFAIKYASDTGTYTYTARPCSGSWTETGVTWNGIPTTGDVSDTASVGNSTRFIDITNTFKAWFAGTYAMANGLYITCATASSRKQIYPHDYSNVEYRPYLVVEWEDPISVPVADKSAYTLGETLNLSMQGAGSDRTHNITYKIGETTVRTATGVGASDAYALPLDLASNITNATSATMTIVCETVIGGTSQGSASISVALTVPGSVVPTISAVTIAETAANWPSALAGKWVQNASKPKVTITAAGAYGSAISAITSRVGSSASVSGSPATHAVITASGTVPVTITVRDSRGRTANYSTNILVLAYEQPRITAFSVTRCDAGGNYRDDGTYARITANVSISALEGANTFWARPDYKANGAANWIDSGARIANEATALNITNQTLGFGGIFDEMTGYNFRLIVADALTTSVAYDDLPTRTIVWDASANGKSLGFGVKAGADGTAPLGLVLAPTSETLQQTQSNLTAATAITATTDILALGRGFYYLNDNSSTDYGFPAVTWSPCIEVSGPINSDTASDGYHTGYWTVLVRGYDGQQWINRRKWDAWTGWKQLLDTGGGTIDGGLTVTGNFVAGGSFTAKNGVLLPETEQGLTGKLYADYGGIILESPNSDSANRRLLSVDNLTFRPDTRYALRIIELRNNTYANYYVPVQTDWTQLTPADGVTTPGEYGNGVLRYRAEGKHVYVAGSINAAWDGSSNKLIATLPAGYRPANGNSYFLQVRGGQNVSRIFIRTTGEINIEWVKSLSDGSNNTGSGWFDLNMDFWID